MQYLGGLILGSLGAIVAFVIFGGGGPGATSSIVGGVMGAAMGYILGCAFEQAANSGQRRPAKPLSQFSRQIAGAKCDACGQTILMATDGRRCDQCELVLHQACAEQHQCAPQANN